MTSSSCMRWQKEQPTVPMACRWPASRGLPEAVVNRARDVLHQLEAGETSGKADRLIDDLPLFSVMLQQEKPKPQIQAKDSELANAVAAISPDELTPREALDLIYKLKELAGKA